MSYRWFTRRSRRTSDLVFITLVAELVQCGLILLLAKPFSAAAALEESILLPKILVNSLGLVAFMRILDRLNRDLTIELASSRPSPCSSRRSACPICAAASRTARGCNAP